MSSEYNTLKYYFTQTNRFHNPYTLIYVDTCGNSHCEKCAGQIFKEFPDDTDEYIESPLIERFGTVCEICLEVLEPDVGYPTDFIEFVEKLQFQGWCLSSAKDFARNHIEDEYIFEQASEHLHELMEIGDQEFPDCAQDISYKYDLNTEDMKKVKELYDEQDAERCLNI